MHSKVAQSVRAMVGAVVAFLSAAAWLATPLQVLLAWSIWSAVHSAPQHECALLLGSAILVWAALLPVSAAGFARDVWYALRQGVIADVRRLALLRCALFVASLGLVVASLVLGPNNAAKQNATSGDSAP